MALALLNSPDETIAHGCAVECEQGTLMGKKKSGGPTRRTLFDSLSNGNANMYCERNVLTNEAAVETFFVNRMLFDLEYRDRNIKPKNSIAELTVSLGGARTARYKPDYVLVCQKKPRWIIDAKNPNENLDKWVPQCSGYCLGLNQTFRGENPVKWFMLTNGIETRVYEWDNATPILTLAFSDFVNANPLYEQLRSLLSLPGVMRAHPVQVDTFKFERPTPQQAKSLFCAMSSCNLESEGQGRIGAFMEFTKLMFVKMWCDRQLRPKRIHQEPVGETRAFLSSERRRCVLDQLD